LYENNVLLYDRQTNSLWSQLKNEAVAGPMTGARLLTLAFEDTTWGAWKKKHPDTLVLSTETGHNRDYSSDPYTSYYRSSRLLFPVEKESKDFDRKEKVIGIERNGKYKAYPVSQLKGQKTINDKIDGEPITINWDESSLTAMIFDSKGNQVSYLISFWYAWYNFHPDTEIYRKAR
jgi:hypothetical protein